MSRTWSKASCSRTPEPRPADGHHAARLLDRRHARRAGAGLRLHERLPRRRQLHRHRGLHRRAQTAARGGVCGLLQRAGDRGVPAQGGGHRRQGHRRPGHRRPARDLRRADRRHRLERDHLVVRHPVVQLARADRRHRRCDAGQGRRCTAGDLGHRQDGGLHLHLAVHGLSARLADDGGRGLDLPAHLAAEGGQGFPAHAAGVGRACIRWAMAATTRRRPSASSGCC